ncbi:cell division protein ZapD [Hydromonas duriensis]|uniref:Cell division protein ZapD n=1 Tax=Hydromonas duriensis TaxID=1527608 RepID=A0A4R6Y6U4_9BURK|nr:cell division protein ZapD [Hydromonas duriensis]TDR28808.1 cell division protein ZapD [Hydromonas duriensis]
MTQASQNIPAHTLFEFPLNERFRTYLRMEALYRRWQYFLQKDDAQDHHSALLVLFEIHEFAFRYDLKGDLLLDINRYKSALNLLRHRPNLSEEKLTQTLMYLNDAQKQIEQSSKFGSTLSENDWLLNVKTRIVVAGGICSFDVAFYYQWLQQPAHVRRMDLEMWMMNLMPMFEGLKLILLIVREAKKHKTCVTQDKAYQQPLNGSRFEMLQIELSDRSPYLPDISANKHVIWLRFAFPNFRSQPLHLRQEIDHAEITFELNLCGMSS